MKQVRSIALLIVATVASCTRPASPPGADLAEALAGRTAGRPERCIDSSTSQGIHAIDSANLAYGWGRTVFVNHLGDQCPGLSSLSTIIVEDHRGQYCRGDRIRTIVPGTTIPGPSCVLSDWIPYTRN